MASTKTGTIYFIPSELVFTNSGIIHKNMITKEINDIRRTPIWKNLQHFGLMHKNESNYNK